MFLDFRAFHLFFFIYSNHPRSSSRSIFGEKETEEGETTHVATNNNDQQERGKTIHSDVSGSDYQLFTQPKTFDEARAICDGIGDSRLSESYNEEINKVLSGLSQEPMWIDGKESDEGWVWLRSDGSPMLGYKNWAPNNPVMGWNGCLQINGDGGPGKWHEVNCTTKNSFICQRGGKTFNIRNYGNKNRKHSCVSLLIY